jgi:hypothetical protein
LRAGGLRLIERRPTLLLAHAPAVVWGADKTKWSSLRTALRRGEFRDGPVTMGGYGAAGEGEVGRERPGPRGTAPLRCCAGRLLSAAAGEPPPLVSCAPCPDPARTDADGPPLTHTSTGAESNFTGVASGMAGRRERGRRGQATFCKGPAGHAWRHRAVNKPPWQAMLILGVAQSFRLS